MLTAILILIILVNFVLLTKGVFNVPTGMMLTALILLILVGYVEAETILRSSFADFAQIAVLFTAVAVPAHILDRSGGLAHIGMRVGELIGKIAKHDWQLIVVSVASVLFLTYTFAAFFHNTTSILIMSTIAVLITKSYKIPTIPVLSGALIASNLGGFSTRWGDTPNIIEAKTWGLLHADFVTQIMPINIGLIFILIAFTSLITWFSIKKKETKNNGIASTYSSIMFKKIRDDMVINKRLMFVGIFGLFLAIVPAIFFHHYELLFAIAAIVVSVLLDEKEHRNESMFTLGIGTYASLLSIFIIAKILSESTIGIGNQLANLLSLHENIAIVMGVSYFGTLLTEAASWATAAAPIVHGVNNSRQFAWALGAGICAGSSSLITAASAGIILLNETANNEEEHRIDFGKYYKFGLGFSSIMLVYYYFALHLVG